MSIDVKQHLNSAQYLAATTIDRPVLVIAGAGSGKTRVIEYRVLHLVQENVSPESILLLTFTRKAANQMMIRAARHDPRCERIDGGTFHSFAFKTLKHYAKLIGLTNSFSILDEGDANELVAKCIASLGLFDVKRRFPKKETVKAIISKSVNKHISIASILEREFPQFTEFAQEIATVRQRYAQYKIEANYVDYDDLLVYLKLLLENQDVRNRIASLYQHIMVDEYQDTNKLQGDIAYLLAESHGNIMAVGDDAQSIYGFRGANHQNIMEFPLRFPNCEVIKLEQNYRSTQSILNVSNVVLDTMKNKYEKRLTAATSDKGLQPQLLCFKNPYEEADWLAAAIKNMRDAGIAFGRQAVLFRSAYVSIPLQTALSKRNIPFQVYGGLKFYETAHVKDMVAHLRILLNPKDELAWGRVLKLIEGIGPKTAETIIKNIAASFTLTECMDTIDTLYNQSSYGEQLKHLTDTYGEASKETLTVADQFQLFIKYYEPLMKKAFDDWHLRLSDLETLRDIAAEYETLDKLLADLALEPPERGVAGIEVEVDDERPVVLSTIHSAKGLEWDVVYVLGMIDGILPSRFAVNFDDELEEEHRLFYVAVTRAKRHLYLTMHHEGNRGGLYQFNRISRFLENRKVLERLDQKLVDTVNHQDDGPKLVSDEDIDGVLDKKTLFKKINDSWRW